MRISGNLEITIAGKPGGELFYHHRVRGEDGRCAMDRRWCIFFRFLGLFSHISSLASRQGWFLLSIFVMLIILFWGLSLLFSHVLSASESHLWITFPSCVSERRNACSPASGSGPRWWEWVMLHTHCCMRSSQMLLMCSSKRRSRYTVSNRKLVFFCLSDTGGFRQGKDRIYEPCFTRQGVKLASGDTAPVRRDN